MVDACVAAALVDELIEIADFQRRRARQAQLRADEAAQLVEAAACAPVGVVERDEAFRIDERIERIAARAQEPDADENKLLPIIAIGGGGTLLSTVFFAENLKRLGTKVASGGKDDGYTKSSNQRRR